MLVIRNLKNLALSVALAGLIFSPAGAETPPPKPVPLAELWVQTSAEYRGLCYQAYGAAGEQFHHWEKLFEHGADGKAYLPGSDKPVAIILDLDETVIDNSGFQAFVYKSGVKFHPSLWDAWVEFQGVNEAAGRTVPGAVEFLAEMKEIGVTPIFISNRESGAEEATKTVLRRNGVDLTDIDQRLFLRRKDEAETAQERDALQGVEPDSQEAVAIAKGEGGKEARRRLVQRRYDVVAYFGDVYGDFDPFVEMAHQTKRVFQQRQAAADANREKWGNTWYILPNPMYGSWGVGSAIPKGEVDSSLNDFGFGVYVRGRRLIK